MKAKKVIAEAEARKIHYELGIRHPSEIEVHLIATSYGAFVRERNLKGVDGLLVRKGKNAIISVRNSIPEEGKKRFVIAHELGHYFLHPQARQTDMLMKDEVDRLSYLQSHEELEANYFAAELLMPCDMFKPALNHCDPSFAEISRLANLFQTTLSATAIQYVKYTQEPCVFIISKNLGKPWFFVREDFDFRVESRDKIHAYSVTADTIKNGCKYDRANDVPAGVWFRGYSDSGKDYITEETFVLGNSGIAYTLLWVHDAI